MTKDEALREAIDTLKSTKHGNCDFAWIDETLKKCTEALAQPPLPVQEPVTWDKPSDNFNEWWDGDRRRDTANPFDTDSFAYWAYEGWQAALAQPVQEPLAWLYPEGLKALQNGKCWTAYPTQHEDCNTPLYIAMPPMPVQEPVGFYVYKPTLPRGNLGGVSDGDLPWVYDQDPSSGYAARMFVYTAPPQRQWVGLTDVDVKNLELTSATSSDVRNISAELKEKNT